MSKTDKVFLNDILWLEFKSKSLVWLLEAYKNFALSEWKYGKFLLKNENGAVCSSGGTNWNSSKISLDPNTCHWGSGIATACHHMKTTAANSFRTIKSLMRREVVSEHAIRESKHKKEGKDFSFLWGKVQEDEMKRTKAIQQWLTRSRRAEPLARFWQSWRLWCHLDAFQRCFSLWGWHRYRCQPPVPQIASFCGPEVFVFENSFSVCGKMQNWHN